MELICADGCGGTCCSYTKTPNTTKGNGNIATGMGLNTCYQTDEKSVKELCDNIDDCKGYYVPTNHEYTMFLPTDKNMSACTSSSSNWKKSDYGSFKTKGINKDYVSGTNTSTSDLVCNKRFYMQKGSGGEDAIKKLCDKLPSCKGYYKDSTNSVFIVADKDPGEDLDMDCMSDSDDEDEDDSHVTGYYTYPSFYKKQNMKNT